jgi:thiol-disulfide isomerase/thioredoxin
MNMPVLRCTAVLLAGLALAGCERSDPPAAAPAPAAQAPTQPALPAPEAEPTATAPELRIATLDGATYDLAEHRGKWVVVNFWATWCAPCLKEMPELSALDAMHEHIEVVGLAYEEIDPDAMRAFLDEHPVVYPIAIVDTYDPPADFDTPRGLPTTWLIAPDGTVAEKILGPVTAASIEAAIAKAGGPPPAAEEPPVADPA